MGSSAVERALPIVLVVDDEPMMRLLMSASLRDGYRILEAADGAEALELWSVAGTEIVAVVTDVRMPRMDGLALAKALHHSAIPPAILFISGFAGGGELPGPYLSKPFTPDQLLDAVRRLLGEPSSTDRL